MLIPELLAPAGSVETFRAAFEAGADAFYLGYGDFNARKRAKNFTEEELRLVAEFARRNGRKIYITVNTLVFDRELPAFLHLCELIREIRADAVIVQDLGAFSLLREQFPEIPLHASTQMFCHNSLHAEFLKKQGAARVILPRELSLREIEMIKDRVPMEYEVFIHGAMCFSFSGCCLASSWLHGDSGNRGICRQACRYSFRKIPGIRPEKREYFPKTSGKELHPFSMRDLNGLEFVKELARIGISALKIEGRMKNAEYVFKTVSAYRDMLDSIREGRPPAGLPEIPFQREAASGYFPGEADYRRLVRLEASGAAGEVFGKVLSVSAHEIRIAVPGKFSKGMRLRVQDSKGRNLCEETLLDYTRISEKDLDVLVWKLRKAVNAAGFTPPYTVYSPGRSAPADTLRFLKNQVRKIAVDTLKIEVEINPGSLTARAFAESMKFKIERVYPLATAASINHPLAEDECARIFNQTGEQPFTVSAVSARVGENLFCTFGNLKETRRLFYRDLHVAYLERRMEESETRKASLTQKLDRIRKRRLAAALPGAFLLGGSPYSPVAVDPAFVAYPIALEGDIESPPSGKTVLILPHFVPEASVDAWKIRIRELTGRGYTRFIAPSYGWLSLVRELPEAEFIAGPYLYAVNSLAVDFLEQNGVRNFILSPDISPGDADSVARFSGRFAALNAPREMFVTRLRIPPGEYVLKGRVFRPRYFQDYTVIEES